MKNICSLIINHKRLPTTSIKSNQTVFIFLKQQNHFLFSNFVDKTKISQKKIILKSNLEIAI